MTEELKPCPFCGREAKVYQDERGYYVSCTHCFTVVGYEADPCNDFQTEAEAIAAWNKMANEFEVMNEELEPCPFCGSKVTIQREHYADEHNMLATRYYVECTGRRAANSFRFYSEKPEEAVDEWNKRVKQWLRN